MDIYTVEDHKITCVLSDISSQYDHVIWTPVHEVYIKEDGTISGNTQRSELTIPAAELLSLKSSSTKHTFTCKITLGTSNTDVSATQTIRIYNPGEDILL